MRRCGRIALAVFAQLSERRAELQTVALEDITSRLQALVALASGSEADVAKLHEPMRDLVREGLAENAQAFNHMIREHGALPWRLGATD